MHEETVNEINELEEVNQIIQVLHSRVKKLMGWDDAKVWDWIGSQNPNFGYVSPMEMILLGRVDRLNRFIDHAEEDLNNLKEGSCDV